MRRLCLGGSFNPIHHGHLICARVAAEHAGFDRVVLIPSSQPPHKPAAADLAAAEDRLAMCRLAAAEQPDLFEVDDIELRRTTPSFTIDTVRELKQRGWDQVAWLIGADMLISLPTWHRPIELLEEVEFFVLARPGWQIDWSALPGPYRRLRQKLIPAPLIDIRATEIRKRVAAGRSVAFLTPKGVEAYIRGRGLYRA